MRFNSRPLIITQNGEENNDNPDKQMMSLTLNQDDMVAIQGSAFNNFEGVSYRALDAINQKEADKEMKRVNRLLKKMASRGQEVLKKTRFNDQNETLLPQTGAAKHHSERTAE